MQDPVQKSVVFPERVKSCNLYRVTGLYSLSILKESKSRRVKSCNPKNISNLFFYMNISENKVFYMIQKKKCFCFILQPFTIFFFGTNIQEQIYQTTKTISKPKGFQKRLRPSTTAAQQDRIQASRVQWLGISRDKQQINSSFYPSHSRKLSLI